MTSAIIDYAIIVKGDSQRQKIFGKAKNIIELYEIYARKQAKMTQADLGFIFAKSGSNHRLDKIHPCLPFLG